MDTLAGLAFSGEPPLPEYMGEPPKKRDAPIVNRYMAGQILCTGLYTMALCLWFLVTGRGLTGGSGIGYRLTAFFGLFMFAAICNAANARTHRLNLLHHLRKNALFIGVMGLVLLIQVGMLFVGGPLFRVAQLTLRDLGWTLCLALTVIPVDAVRKLVSNRLHGMERGV